MNLVEKMEKELIEEIKRITGYQGFDWGKVFLDRGDVDFCDSELEVVLCNESYGNKFNFNYDYESETGDLYKIDAEGNYIELWSKEKGIK